MKNNHLSTHNSPFGRMRRLFFCCLLYVVSNVARAQSGTTGDLEWSIKDGILTISGTGAMPDYVTTTRPYRITSPWYNYSFSVVVISDGVTSVGDYAFMHSNVTSISIGKSVTSIGKYAFNCYRLMSINVDENNTIYASEDGVLLNKLKTELLIYPYAKPDLKYTIPNSVKTIGSYAFEGCSLMEVIIPNSVISIGDYAFASSSLTSVSIGNSVASIGNNAFIFCFSLTKINIPASVESIGDYAFESCSSLTAINVDENNTVYASDDGVLINMSKTELIKYPEGKPDLKYTIPNSVTSIAACAFYDLKGLMTVTIPNSVVNIGSSAFSGCSSLTSVSIGNSVESIGDFAFYGCSSLTSIIIPNSVTYIGRGAFICHSLAEVIIGTSVEFIGDDVFSGCSSLTSVAIPNSVTYIGDWAFSGCSSLTSVCIGNSVESIGSFAFWGCSILKSVAVPNSVTYIGVRAFENCSSLMSVTIPNSVTYIGIQTFDGCYSLTSVDVEKNNKVYASEYGVLFNKSKTVLIRYPIGKPDVIYVIPNTVESIENYAFSGCYNLTGVTIPNSVTSIGYCAFYFCGGLTSIVIPNSVESIGSFAFWFCSNLTSVSIGNSVTSIGGCAFGYCSSLTEVINLAMTPQIIDETVFSDVNISQCILRVHHDVINDYKAAEVWRDFLISSEITGVVHPDAPLTIVYPNPTKGSLTLQFEIAGEYVVTIYDMTGKILFRQTASQHITLLDLSNYPAGVYLLTIDHGEQRSTTRVVKN